MSELEIGVLGATGPAGSGVAVRLASLGHRVLVGSRDAARSASIVGELQDRWGARAQGLCAASNIEAAHANDVVVLAVPWEAAASTAKEHANHLAGRVLISMANALRRKERHFEAVLSPRRSIAAEVQAAAPKALVVSALQHVPAAAFGNLDRPMDGDVIICSDHADALVVVGGLIRSIPDLRAFEGGPLKNSLGVEAFAAVLLSVNVRHKVRASLKLSGIDG